MPVEVRDGEIITTLNFSPMMARRLGQKTFLDGETLLTYKALQEKYRTNEDKNIVVTVVQENAIPVASASKPPTHKIPVAVHTFTPGNTCHTHASLETRFEDLRNHVLTLSDKPDIFLAPEYYFNWTETGQAASKQSSEEQGKTWKLAPYTREKRDQVVEGLRELSRSYPEMVLIPGTIVWYDAHDGRSKPALHNSAYVFRNGQELKSGDLARYDKAAVDYEQTHLATTKYEWTSGGIPRFDFEHKGLQCRLAICADAGLTLRGESDNEKDKIDLQLIVASKFGQKSKPDTHIGGWCVHADGDGWSTAIQRSITQDQGREAVRPNSETYRLEVEKEVREGIPPVSDH